MNRLLSRTSITIDEAVSILLGQSTGPIDFEPMGDEEEDDGSYVFCLQDVLADERDVLEGEYDLAKYETEPDDVIAEKLAALQRQEAVIDRANLHVCAIQDELNKGEQSVLKVDRTLSNAAHTFITLHSFNEWRKRLAGDQSGTVQSTESVQPSTEGAKQKVVRDKGVQQGDAILAEIRKQGFDPMALPPKPPGRPGVKAAVRAALTDSPLFKGSKVFDKAWERLRKDRLMADESDPPPPKNTMGETSGGG